MSSEEDMAYIARRPCGCICMVTVDKPEYAKDNAKEIAACMRKGCTIERVTCEQVRTTHWLSDCDQCKKPKKKRKGSSVSQEALPL